MRGFKKYDKKIRCKERTYRKNGIRFKEVKIKEIENLYVSCPIKVAFRERFCLDCKEKITRSYQGYCHTCYMKHYHKRHIYKNTCKNCGKIILSDRHSKYCNYQCYWEDMDKIEWPNKKEIEKMLKNNSWRSVAKILGVTLASLQRKAEKLGVKRPGRHYSLLINK